MTSEQAETTATAAVSFRDAYGGWLSGLLDWDDVVEVFDRIRADGRGWWIYDTRSEVPAIPVGESEIANALDEILSFLRRHHRADYCGFVYVDDKNDPRLVKVYDPRNASSCSLGTPIPAYTISAMQPEPLPFGDDEGDVPGVAGSPGILKRILKRG